MWNSFYPTIFAPSLQSRPDTQTCFAHFDLNQDNTIDVQDLISWSKSRESFSSLSSNTKSLMKMIHAAQTKLGIPVSQQTDSLSTQTFSKFLDMFPANASNLNKIGDCWVTLAGVKPLFSIATGKHLFSGAIAGAVSRTAAAPLERLKILRQIEGMGGQSSRQYTGLKDALVRVTQEEGMLSWFKGNGVNVVRISPYMAIQFAAFELASMALMPDQEFQLPKHLLPVAGAFAGLTSASFTYPLDVIRTRLAAQGNQKLYSGIFDCGKKIVQNEGWTSLYNGLNATSLGVLPYVSLNFTLYHILRRTLPLDPETGEPLVFPRLVAGAAAGTVAQCIAFPFDVLRRRLQVDGTNGSPRKYKNMMDAIRVIYKQDTWRGFYRGLWANCLKIVPTVSLQFVTYETVMGMLQQKD